MLRMQLSSISKRILIRKCSHSVQQEPNEKMKESRAKQKRRNKRIERKKMSTKITDNLIGFCYFAVADFLEDGSQGSGSGGSDGKSLCN